MSQGRRWPLHPRRHLLHPPVPRDLQIPPFQVALTWRAVCVAICWGKVVLLMPSSLILTGERRVACSESVLHGLTCLPKAMQLMRGLGRAPALVWLHTPAAATPHNCGGVSPAPETLQQHPKCLGQVGNVMVLSKAYETRHINGDTEPWFHVWGQYKIGPIFLDAKSESKEDTANNWLCSTVL